MWLNKRSLRHKSENIPRGLKVSKIWCSLWGSRQCFCLCRALSLWFILFCWVSLHIIACSYFSWNRGISNKNLKRFWCSLQTVVMSWAPLSFTVKKKGRHWNKQNRERRNLKCRAQNIFIGPNTFLKNVYCNACELISCSAWQTTFPNKVSQIKTFFLLVFEIPLILVYWLILICQNQPIVWLKQACREGKKTEPQTLVSNLMDIFLVFLLSLFLSIGRRQKGSIRGRRKKMRDF